jgi:hypothetical protein
MEQIQLMTGEIAKVAEMMEVEMHKFKVDSDHQEEQPKLIDEDSSDETVTV